jgi:hypothetical protein
MKEKHVKLRLSLPPDADSSREFSDSAVLPRLYAQSSKRSSRMSITHHALGWRMAERVRQAELLPGDALDIAFTLDHNDHPDFGGLELSLRDFKTPQHTARSLTRAVAANTTEN